MQLVLQALGELLHNLVSKSTKFLSSLAMLNNKATQVKLERTNNLATQAKQCD
jgi:ubiquinone biosynthesis protein UbiJ